MNFLNVKFGMYSPTWDNRNGVLLGSQDAQTESALAAKLSWHLQVNREGKPTDSVSNSPASRLREIQKISVLRLIVSTSSNNKPEILKFPLFTYDATRFAGLFATGMLANRIEPLNNPAKLNSQFKR